MSPNHYVTYFDRHYLTRGLALYHSLARNGSAFVLWILCLDFETEQTLRRLELDCIRPISLPELENADGGLLEVKRGRMPVEYYWTCGPALLLYVFRLDSTIELLTYLDADLFCFSDPAPVYEELGANSILIIEQRVPKTDAVQPAGGKYNVGLLVFRRGKTALGCLERWRKQCLEWCFDRFEPDRHGDQKYLDDWPTNYDVTILQYPGAGLAPWNIHAQQIGRARRQILVNGVPLIFYHFARIRRINRFCYEMHDSRFNRQPAHRLVVRHIYGPYVRALYRAEQEIRRVRGRVFTGTARTNTPGELIRRSRAAGARWTNLKQYRRFIFVLGDFVF